MAGSLKTQPNDEDEQYVLVICLDDTKVISLLLKAIQFKNTATFCASSDGLKVTVEDSKSVQGSAFIQASLFQDYILKEQCVVFRIHLNVLVDCLNIFGCSSGPNTSTTSLKICYEGYGFPLRLFLQENEVLTVCELNTLEAENTLDFEFSPAKVVNKIIMKSDVLKEAWGDLDMNSDHLQILLSPNPPYLQLSTKGTLGTIYVNCSRNSDMIESFQCIETQINRYQICLIKHSLKALQQSTKISIRTDERGFLCLQYMIKADSRHVCFVEYICAPDEEIGDNNNTLTD